MINPYSSKPLGSKVARNVPWLFGLLLLLTGNVLPVLAQNRTVSGKVTSADDGSGLPGVNVLVKGTSTGVVTDATGKYSISTPADGVTLVFSFIGYTPQEVIVGTRSTIDVSLAADVKALQEVVVTGYTTQQKKDLTSAVAVVSPKELLAVPASSVEQQLQGRAAGVTVVNSNVPGQGANVRIRGFGTFGNNDPLYVIDGVPTKDNLANFNQNDIESIQILKDATSASIYGSRAGNGVVIITTKKGKSGEPRLTFDSYYGIQNPRKSPELLNTQEYGEYLWQSKLNAGVVNETTKNPEHGQYGNGPTPLIPDYLVPSGAFEGDPRVDPANYSIDRFDDPEFGKSKFQITPANKQGTKWLDEIFEPAPIQNYQLGVTGGSDKGRYAFSVGHFNQQGIMLYNGFKRYTLRANTEFTVKNRLRIGENLQVLYAQRKGQYGNQSEGNEVFMAYRMQPIVPVYDIAGNFAGTLGNNLGNAKSPVAALYRSRNNGYRDLRIFGNAYAELDFLKGFTARTSFGVDGTIGRGRYSGVPEPEVSEPGRTYSFAADFNYRYTYTWTNTLTYKTKIGESHNLTAYIGTEAITSFGENQGGFRDRYFSGDPLLQYLNQGDAATQTNYNGAINDFRLFSLFGQANYSFRDRYLFQAIVRRDASSRFLAATRYATFPAFSIGWRVTEEPFMQNISFISDLKLRAGWGQTGNQEGILDYNAFTTYQSDPFQNGYSLNGDPGTYAQGFDVGQFGRPTTKWETNTSTNIGFDLSMLKDRVEVNFDLFNRKTEDLLLQPPVQFTHGQGTFAFSNVASIRNRGIDLGINYRDEALNNQLRYAVGLILSTYRNKVLLIDPNNDAAFIPGIGLRTPPVTRSIKGRPLSSHYGYVIDGIFQTEEEAAAAPSFPGYNDAPVYIDGVQQKGVGKFKYRDVNGDGRISDDDQTFIGNPHPKFSYGLNLNIGYKNFDLTAFLQGVSGNDVFNYVRYWTDFNTFQGNRSKRVLYDSWTPQRPNAKLPILDENDAISSRPSTYFIEKGSYARLKNLQLTYTLPAPITSKIGLGQLKVYIQGQNLFTITKYTGVDPELPLRENNNNQFGVDEGVYPAARSYIVGLSIGL